jgi:hypothetical protein
MRAEKDSRTRPRKKTATRILKLVLALIVVLIVLVLFLVPAFVSSGKGRQIILAKINNSIGGRTSFADLSMGWFRGINVEGVSFNDSAGQIAVQVKQIAAKPRYGSILTGSLSFGETIIDEPKVEINLKDLRREPSAGKRARPVVLPIKRIDLVLNDGNLKVTDQKANTVELSQINSKVNLRPPGQQTNFDLNMAVVDGGKTSKIQVASQITPKQQTGWTLEGTSGNLTVEVNDLDLESLGPIFALAGVEVQAKGLIGGQIKSEIKDGRFENLSGDIKGKNLDITSAKLKGDRLQTSSLDVGINLNRQKETINIDNLQIKSDWAFITASGVVPTTLKSFADFFQADSNYSLKGNFNFDIAAISSQIPKTLGLKEGMQITSGQLNGNVETSTRAGRRQIQAQGTLTGLEGAVEGKKIALSKPIMAETQISSDKAGINFDKLDVSAPFAKINCTGTTELLNYNADVDLAKLQSELGQFINAGQYQMAGEFLGKGQISIKEKKITTSGSSVVKNLRLSSKEAVTASEPMANVAFAFDIDRGNNTIAVDSLKADASFGQVNIKDAVLPLNKKSVVPLQLAISANSVDLNKLQPFAVLFASFPQQMQLAGIADSNISISSKKDIYRITTTSTKIANLKFSYPGQKPFESKDVSLVFDAEVNPEQKTINIAKLQLESPQIKMKGEFKQVVKADKTQLEGLIDYEYDWSALSTVAGPFLPKGLTLQGERKDTINFTSEYPSGQTDKLLAGLSSTKAKLGFEKAQYIGMNFGPTNVDVQIQEGLLKIAPFATTVNNGQFNFAGQADFKQKPALLKTANPVQMIKDIEINDEMTRRLLIYLSPIFANAVNVSGIVNFGCEQLTIPLSAAAKNQAEVVGTISISRLRLQASDLLGQILSLAGKGVPGQDLTIHPTRFVLQNGFLRYDDMQVDVGDSPINFTNAVIGLDKSYDMTVVLPWTLSGRTARVGEDVGGERIKLRLKTSAGAKPELDLGGLLQEMQKQLLKDAVRRGLEELFK